MDLKTISVLNIDDERIVKKGQNIVISLTNGEVLIGKFTNSDFNSLTIERREEPMDILFSEIKDITLEKL